MTMERTSETVRETTEPPAHPVGEVDELAHHPGPRQYVMVAVVLAIATALEVALYYVDLPHGLFAAMLLFFAVVKFSLVVLWFMHLRFDSPIFRQLFVAGLILAVTVYMIVLVIFGAFNAPWLLGIAAFLVMFSLIVAFRALRGKGRRVERELIGRTSPESG